MKQYGLIGFPLTHSFSKKYFEEKFKRENISNCSYDLFPIESVNELPALLAVNAALSGLNVTIPHKETVLPYLTGIDETAQKIGAVNCIKIVNGSLTGFNTDYYGFTTSLQRFLTATPAQTFVLGTGGSAKAICYALETLGLAYMRVSRQAKTGHITYQQIEEQLEDSNLFINTTPLGMFPNTGAAPQIPYNKLGPKDFLFDLVYNPAETLFLQKGKKQGCFIKNGLEMLELQAEKSWEIWND